MEPAAANKSCSGMAEMTVHRSCKVGAVHASGRIPVTTGRTVIYDAGVIKRRADETGSIVAHTAILCCGNVCG